MYICLQCGASSAITALRYLSVNGHELTVDAAKAAERVDLGMKTLRKLMHSMHHTWSNC
jgi:hypothetical protein